MKAWITKDDVRQLDWSAQTADALGDALHSIEESIIARLDIASDDVDRIARVKAFVRGGAKQKLEDFVEGLDIALGSEADRQFSG